MTVYSKSQRILQERFGTVGLADRLEQTIFSEEIVPELHGQFIQSRDFFFLSTVNDAGEPTVSYKGGGIGIVTVVDAKTLAFPIYDGNGMFLSAGNIASTAKIGMLFIDFETPNRVRVQATASISDDPGLAAKYPGAKLISRAEVDHVFINCARYIHKHSRVENSPYVPDSTGKQPYPSWKRIDFVQDVLAPGDQGRAADEGGLITIEDYGAKVAAGES